jgi:hypothetical protein
MQLEAFYIKTVTLDEEHMNFSAQTTSHLDCKLLKWTLTQEQTNALEKAWDSYKDYWESTKEEFLNQFKGFTIYPLKNKNGVIGCSAVKDNEIHVFSIRTFFWWGNFFSISLHLAGGFKVLFERKLKQKKIMLPEGIFICIHETPWQYHFESDNFMSAQGMSSEDITEFMAQKEFIKMAFKLDLIHWNEAGDWCVRKYDEIGLLLN